MDNQTTNLPARTFEDDVDVKINDYFTNYYKIRPKVTDNEYDYVKSYFMERTGNTQATAALASAVIITANDLNMPVIEIVQNFTNSSFKQSIPMFLNMSRRGSSLLGYLQQLQPSENISRQTVL